MRALGLGRVSGFYLVLGAVGVGVLAIDGGLGLLLPQGLAGWLAGGGLGLGVGVILVWLSRLLTSRFVWASGLAQELRSVVGELGRSEALIVALLSGVGEEVLFRGVLQPLVGLWLSAAVFGALHLGPSRRFWPWALMAFVAGLIFGGMFVATGCLLAPVVAHATVNFLNLRFLAVADRRPLVHVGPVSGEQAAR
jgi:uncharacterized protein